MTYCIHNVVVWCADGHPHAGLKLTTSLTHLSHHSAETKQFEMPRF